MQGKEKPDMRAIDAWVNVRIAGLGWQKQVAASLFKRSVDTLRSYTTDEMIAMMDLVGVEKAIIGVSAESPEADALAFTTKHPDRFALAAQIDPRRGLKAVRALEKLAQNEPVVAIRVLPCVIATAPDDRIYYPLYAKAVELGLPVCVTTGIPGPPLPGKCQDPMHLDDVCLFFPELTVVMANGADPWWAVAIRLMLKYPNLYLMTSACAPRYLPAELIHFMNTRGKDKILFATDFPFLPMERCLQEVGELDLRDGVRDKFLYDNAAAVFFTVGRKTVSSQ
jgi:uncharacterized protein